MKKFWLILVSMVSLMGLTQADVAPENIGAAELHAKLWEAQANTEEDRKSVV